MNREVRTLFLTLAIMILVSTFNNTTLPQNWFQAISRILPIPFSIIFIWLSLK